MRIKPSSIFLILLACLYCYGGSGFAIVDFCCNSCKVKGAEQILAEGCHHEEEEEVPCCQDSHEHDTPQEDIICHNHCNHINHCNVKSYQIDLSDTVQKLRCSIPVVDLSFLPLKILPDFTNYFFKEKYFFETPPLLYSSRDILAKDSVLLI